MRNSEGVIPRRCDGVALVLVAGTLTLLAALAAAFVAGTRLASRVSGSAGTAAELAAESGLHYAASRLVEASYPRYPRTPETRGDDWSYRDPATVPLARAQNPSYAHGSDGASGRLRGAEGVLFALRIVSTGAKIPVNAFSGSYPSSFATIRGLAHTLNNLGAIVLPAGHPRRCEIQMTGTTLPYSRLGDDMLSGRPPGGYSGWTDLTARLRAQGGGTWYNQADIDLFSSFATTAPPITTPQGGPARFYPITPSWEQAAPVELATAPFEVLSALWRLIGGADPCLRATAYWETTSRQATDPRTGSSFSASLLPDDADALADDLVRRRETLPQDAFSWNALRQRLTEHAGSLFPVAPPDPIARTSYLYAKGDVAFLAVSPDPNPYPTVSPTAWASWGVARPIGPADAFSRPWLDGLGLKRIYPSATGFVFEASAPLGLTMRPPQRFEIDCSAGDSRYDRRMSVSTAIDTGTRTLSLTSQADFENPDSVGTALRPIGIREARNDAVWSDPSYTGRRQKEMDSTLGWTTHRLASLPECGPGYYPTPPGQTQNPATYPWFRQAGALTLARNQAGGYGADLYWPFAESADTDRTCRSRPENAGTVLDWRGAEFTPLPNPEDPFPQPIRSWMAPTNFTDPLRRSLFTPFFASGDDLEAVPTLVVSPQATPGIPFPGIQPNQPIRYIAIEFWTRDAPLHRALPSFQNYVMRLDTASTGNSLLTFKATEFFNHPTLFQSGQIGTSWELQHTGTVIRPNQPNTPIGLNPRVNLIDAQNDPHVHYVRIVLQSGQVNGYEQTTLTLQVDGSSASESSQLWQNYSPPGASLLQLSVRNVSDLKIYGSPDAGEGTAREAGRFVRSGEYISPLYVFERPVRVIGTQWTGITPAGWAPENAIAVEATGYADDLGLIDADLAMPPRSGMISTETSHPIRSLRYEVELSVPSGIPDAAALDTPVFEGIWFAFRPVGARVGWVDWAAR